MRRTCLRFAVVASLLATFTMAACGNGANDVTGCRQLEFARCARAHDCGLDLAFPLGPGTSAADETTACQEFYYDACLHGFVTSIVITPSDMSGCLKAITTGSCNAVVNPQSQPACSWLNPPDAGVDSGVDATVVDTGTPDVVVVVTTTPDTGVDSGLQSCINACPSMCVDDPGCEDECESGCEGEF